MIGRVTLERDSAVMDCRLERLVAPKGWSRTRWLVAKFDANPFTA